jgi:hypothetical protein
MLCYHSQLLHKNSEGQLCCRLAGDLHVTVVFYPCCVAALQAYCSSMPPAASASRIVGARVYLCAESSRLLSKSTAEGKETLHHAGACEARTSSCMASSRVRQAETMKEHTAERGSIQL